MTRLEELTLKCADDCLAFAESRELELLVNSDQQAAGEYLGLLSLEAALRASRKDFDLCDSILEQLQRERAKSIEAKVIARIQAEAPPPWHVRSTKRAPSPIARSIAARVLAFAASVVLLLGLGIWFFGPTIGEPVLAQTQASDVMIERGTEFIRGLPQMPLRANDVLRTGTNAVAMIIFGTERTSLQLGFATELKLASFAGGKQLELRIGKIEATVARQRPLAPMVILTPQAQARVLGTHFRLTVDADVSRLEVIQGKVGLLSVHDGKKTKVGAGQWARAGTNIDLRGPLPATGRILYEYWTNVTGIFDPTWDSKLGNHPDGTEHVEHFEAGGKQGDIFGVRIRGYLQPPKTGDYTFWIAGDGFATFKLSRDDQPRNKVWLATAADTNPGEWTKERKQQSSVITLTAGRKYYVEVVQDGGKGSHHLAVAWQGPDREREVIPGEFLSPFDTKPKDKKGK